MKPSSNATSLRRRRSAARGAREHRRRSRARPAAPSATRRRCGCTTSQPSVIPPARLRPAARPARARRTWSWRATRLGRHLPQVVPHPASIGSPQLGQGISAGPTRRGRRAARSAPLRPRRPRRRRRPDCESPGPSGRRAAAPAARTAGAAGARGARPRRRGAARRAPRAAGAEKIFQLVEHAFSEGHHRFALGEGQTRIATVCRNFPRRPAAR